MDVCDPESVKAAAQKIAADLGDKKIYAVVNIAGVIEGDSLLDTNFYGVKFMCDAFIPLMDSTVGRIVNVSGGPCSMYVGKQDGEKQKLLTNDKITWAQID